MSQLAMTAPDVSPLLSEKPLPETHWPYYTKRLACWWVCSALGAPPVLWVGPDPAVPAWRLTPESFAWFNAAAEALRAKPDKAEQVKLAAVAVADMFDWLAGHGQANAVRLALANPKPQLPNPPPLLPDQVEARSYNFRDRACL